VNYKAEYFATRHRDQSCWLVAACASSETGSLMGS
jgi:hypothetical protein